MNPGPTDNKCRLCGRSDQLSRAPFKQLYAQFKAPPIVIHWHRCSACSGLFAFPLPTEDQIALHWQTVNYNESMEVGGIHHARSHIVNLSLSKLATLSTKGNLLDIGSNYGLFLKEARADGWNAHGFEPCKAGIQESIKNGFDVRQGWQLNDAGFDAEMFHAITAFDSFCYDWHPYRTLAEIHRLLKPRGVLTMRLSNKRHVIGGALIRYKNQPHLDAKITALLQNQFHSIGIASFEKILMDLGFTRTWVVRNAYTAPWKTLTLKSRIAYAGAEAIYQLSFHRLNISPGVLLIAQK